MVVLPSTSKQRVFPYHSGTSKRTQGSEQALMGHPTNNLKSSRYIIDIFFFILRNYVCVRCSSHVFNIMSCSVTITKMDVFLSLIL